MQEFQLLEGNLEINNALRAQKKQIIRDKAVALLYKVKSAEKFSNRKLEYQYQHEDMRVGAGISPRGYY